MPCGRPGEPPRAAIASDLARDDLQRAVPCGRPGEPPRAATASGLARDDLQRAVPCGRPGETPRAATASGLARDDLQRAVPCGCPVGGLANRREPRPQTVSLEAIQNVLCPAGALWAAWRTAASGDRKQLRLNSALRAGERSRQLTEVESRMTTSIPSRQRHRRQLDGPKPGDRRVSALSLQLSTTPSSRHQRFNSPDINDNDDAGIRDPTNARRAAPSSSTSNKAPPAPP